MNNTRSFGLLICGALGLTLGGCTTYVEQPRERVYSEPPPPAQRAYVEPRSYPQGQPSNAYAQPDDSSSYEVVRSESDFYEPLQPYGRWEVVGSYGRCWIPVRVERDWRPYCNGNWTRTDAGWYWVSAEPWGWATYHYGRWAFDVRFGWFWVPQLQWAPAWVSWHEGGGYIGWAPLPPSARFSGRGYLEVNVAPPPRAIVFVYERSFLEPVRPTTVIVNNTTIINKTVNITNIKVVNKTVINEGPRTTVIERASGRKIQAEPVREVRRKQEAEVVAKIRGGKDRNELEQRSTRPVVAPDPQRPVTEDKRQHPNEDRRTGQVEREKVEAERRATAQQQQEQRAAEKRAQQEEKRAAEIQRNQAEGERRAAAQREQEQRATEDRARQEQRTREERDRKQQEEKIAERRARQEQEHAAELERRAAAQKQQQQRAVEEHARQEQLRAEEAKRQEAVRQQNQERAAQKRAEQEQRQAERAAKKHPGKKAAETNEVDRAEKKVE